MSTRPRSGYFTLSLVYVNESTGQRMMFVFPVPNKLTLKQHSQVLKALNVDLGFNSMKGLPQFSLHRDTQRDFKDKHHALKPGDEEY